MNALSKNIRQIGGLVLALSLTGCGLTTPASETAQPGSVSEASASEQVAATPAAAAVSAGGSENDDTPVTRPAGWDEASHGADADPDYAIVFPDAAVNQLTITIAPDDWDAMMANMTEIFGEQGSGEQGGGPPGGPGGGQQPPGGGGPGGGPGGVVRDAENPMWVSGTVTFNGQTWTEVGVRFKGNSSLRSTWSSGSLKLPLKLDFDQFEDESPEITDQRFYGFKQLSFGNGFGDATYMREVVSYELLDAVGLPAAETAYYEIVLDYGEGPVSMGLYTAVEVIDDTVIEREYGDDEGNIYEADGPAASLAAGTEAQIAETFQKENNEDAADWSDVEELNTVVNSELRLTDPAAWRAELERVFNVDGFLEWLALKTALQHWDTYGQMAHNYYLYDNPETGQLDFISWDHNLVLGAQPGGRGGRGGGMNTTVSFDQAEVTESWPLIRYLLDDAEYQARYTAALQKVAGVFDAELLAVRYQELAALIGPVVAQTEDPAAFQAAVQSLTQTTTARAEALAQYLATK
ncbi:MAG: CotH kinase family protein [Anaerolineales bacterium]|nr:CotH kinase family protein [Anaerolineales bacterium]